MNIEHNIYSPSGHRGTFAYLGFRCLSLSLIGGGTQRGAEVQAAWYGTGRMHECDMIPVSHAWSRLHSLAINIALIGVATDYYLGLTNELLFVAL